MVHTDCWVGDQPVIHSKFQVGYKDFISKPNINIRKEESEGKVLKLSTGTIYLKSSITKPVIE